MAHIYEDGYCRKCKKITPHRFILMIRCKECGYVSTPKEYVEALLEKENHEEKSNGSIIIKG
jgi:hypothetical protein